MADKWTEKEFDAEIEEESLELAEGEEPEMFEHFRLNVDVGQTPIRIDKYMAEHMEDTSRHRVQLAIREGYVHVGDKLRSEEHTSELQSQLSPDLVCRLLLEIGRASCRERV